MRRRDTHGQAVVEWLCVMVGVVALAAALVRAVPGVAPTITCRFQHIVSAVDGGNGGCGGSGGGHRQAARADSPHSARGATARTATARRPPPPDPTTRGPRDSDNDGIPDARERRLGTNPHSADSDHDGVSDWDEIHDRRSNPFLRDSDHDGLDDRTERDLGTDPRNRDSDRDGLDDLTETALGTDPRRRSSDKTPGDLDDGLTDGQELALGTDPLSWDTDGDGDSDGWEVAHGDDPKHAEFIKSIEDFFLDDPVSTAIGGVEARIASKVASRLLKQLATAPRSLRLAKTAMERAKIFAERLRAVRGAIAKRAALAHKRAIIRANHRFGKLTEARVIGRFYPDAVPIGIDTPFGWRFVDALRPDGTAIEIKTGRVPYSRVKRQLQKDLWLRAHNPEVRKVVWHFAANRKGQIGPDAKLEKALRDNGIEIVYDP